MISGISYRNRQKLQLAATVLTLLLSASAIMATGGGTYGPVRM